MSIEFSDAATKSAYKATTEKDRHIFVPATKKSKEYDGRLINIPPEVAETLLSQGVTLLQKLPPSRIVKPPDPAS